MRTLILASLVLSTSAIAQQPCPTTIAPLRASIYGVALSGARELEPSYTGKTKAQKVALFDAGLRHAKKGEALQLTVKTTAGTVVTTDPRTKYAAVGCLSVSAAGFITSDFCEAGDVPEVWVMMVDAQQHVLACNRFAFSID